MKHNLKQKKFDRLNPLMAHLPEIFLRLAPKRLELHTRNERIHRTKSLNLTTFYVHSVFS